MIANTARPKNDAPRLVDPPFPPSSCAALFSFGFGLLNMLCRKQDRLLTIFSTAYFTSFRTFINPFSAFPDASLENSLVDSKFWDIASSTVLTVNSSEGNSTAAVTNHQNQIVVDMDFKTTCLSIITQ